MELKEKEARVPCLHHRPVAHFDISGANSRTIKCPGDQAVTCRDLQNSAVTSFGIIQYSVTTSIAVCVAPLHLLYNPISSPKSFIHNDPDLSTPNGFTSYCKAIHIFPNSLHTTAGILSVYKQEKRLCYRSGYFTSLLIHKLIFFNITSGT